MFPGGRGPKAPTVMPKRPPKRSHLVTSDPPAAVTDAINRAEELERLLREVNIGGGYQPMQMQPMQPMQMQMQPAAKHPPPGEPRETELKKREGTRKHRSQQEGKSLSFDTERNPWEGLEDELRQMERGELEGGTSLDEALRGSHLGKGKR